MKYHLLAAAAATMFALTGAAQAAGFTDIKQINAGDLNVGYVDQGPANGPVVILLHGWPYDINSYADVAPLLTKAGYRVIIPHLRGYGSTRFINAGTPRNGEPAALAADVVALMDALKIEKATLAGYDWGARTADIIAALWPQRVAGLVSVSGYLIGSQEAGEAKYKELEEQLARTPNISVPTITMEGDANGAPHP